MSHSVSRAFEFDYAHRLLKHESSCKYIHGHRGRAVVTLSTLALDQMGMVIDFKIVKERVLDFVNKYWDHNILLQVGDPLIELIKCNDCNYGKDPYLMMKQPTAENMAEALFNVCKNDIFKDMPYLAVEKVKIFETPSCCSTYKP